jgi:hypothetical protein
MNNCNKVKSMGVQERWDRIRERQRSENICNNCWAINDHKAHECTKKECSVQGCGKRHHALLHQDPKPGSLFAALEDIEEEDGGSEEGASS